MQETISLLSRLLLQDWSWYNAYDRLYTIRGSCRPQLLIHKEGRMDWLKPTSLR